MVRASAPLRLAMRCRQGVRAWTRPFRSSPLACAPALRDDDVHRSSWSASWPSSEEVAYAFAKLSIKEGGAPLDFKAFLKATNFLRTDLTEVEIRRVFETLDSNHDGKISLSKFQSGAASSAFLRCLVQAVVREWSLQFEVKPDYDFTKSTEENYQAPLAEGFHGEFAEIRPLLDYSYHSNYTRERQLWQDRLIHKSVILTEQRKPRPWLVHTCGPMGAGKGYVLGWMSANGYLPLEHISKIDPDHFKRNFPEWPAYVQFSLHEAGTQCHKESGYIAEIAQEVAMRKNMHVWIDGSLRNHQFYERKFKLIREKFPGYHIAILAVTAHESIIQERLQLRGEKTDRFVPPQVARTASEAIHTSVPKLTRLVDFYAQISNNGEVPELQFVELYNTKGDWTLIKRLTDD